MTCHRVVVVGAGLAGLSCAVHLRDLTALVLEQGSAVGGLARTVRRGAFFFDVTGHWLHVATDADRALIEHLFGDGLERIERRAAVYFCGHIVPYPFQAHTYGLPQPIILDCVLGYMAAREARFSTPRTLSSFEDFILERLGEGIARHFMLPYNTKLWTAPPRELDWRWCERFVPQPTPEEVVAGALSSEGAGHALGYNSTFYYPKAGGIGFLAETLAKRMLCELRLKQKVTRIDWTKHTLFLSDGSCIPYGVLVSTMPLPTLIETLDSKPEVIRAAAAQLRAASVTYFDIGLPNPNLPNDPHWLYFPHASEPFYRVGSPSAVQPSLAPAGTRSLYVEVSHPYGTSIVLEEETLLAALRRVRLVGTDEEPMVMARSTIDDAYVIMDHAYEKARLTILDWLSEIGIFSIGRYGHWIYDSMMGALQAGREAAHQVVHCLGAGY